MDQATKRMIDAVMQRKRSLTKAQKERLDSVNQRNLAIQTGLKTKRMVFGSGKP